MIEIGRFLGLDYGDVRIGVAISDPFGKIATPLEIISRHSEQEYKPVLRRLNQIIKEYSIKKIILGYPKHMNNIEGENCKKVLKFKQLLESSTSIDIILFDERLTTVMAKTIITNNETRNSKKSIDKFAAALILQGFLERREKMNEDFGNELFDEEDDEEITTITMIDDEGNETSFVLVEIFSHKEKEYYIMFKEDDMDNDEDNDDETVEIHIFKKIGEDNDDINLEEITEEEFDEIASILEEKMGDIEIDNEV